MNLLNKNVEDVSFEDVVELCKAGTIESAVLDYKQSMPRDLAKHFATFSNTYGGLIIIGVEEDPATGKPKNFDGIKYDSKLVDQINQFAANVTPFPRYKVHITNEHEGNVFLLIKILEGDQPPYTSNHDLTVWLRTGNVSTPLRNPDSRELEQLYRKREAARGARDEVFARSNAIYEASLGRAEEERTAEIRQNQHIYADRIGSNASLLRISISPVSPTSKIVDYRLIKQRLTDYRVETRFSGDYPSLNNETVPNGLSFFDWSRVDGAYEYGLVQDNGFIDNIHDIQRFNKETRVGRVYLSHILGLLVRQFDVASKFYKLAGFHGLLFCKIDLTRMKGVLVEAIVPEGYYSLHNPTPITKLDSYQWIIDDLDTFRLNDRQALVKIVYEFIERLYWDFGITPPQQALVEAQLNQIGWKLSDEK